MGYFEIVGCPKEMITPDISKLIFAAELAEKGKWPNGGGWLDETASCVSGIRMVWYERDLIESKMFEAARK